MKFKLFILLFLALILIFSVDSISAAGDTIYVNDTGGNDDNDGSDWNTAKKTIKNATGSVNVNGIVNIANGQYNGTNNTQITIDKNMTINGESQTGTIINGTGTNWIFNINPGINLTLNNLAITNASGGILNQGNLSVINCSFTNNFAEYSGGAIINYYGNLSVTDCSFLGNTANDDGGAIHNYYGSLSVSDSSFTGNDASRNDASRGGAIYSQSGSVFVNGCSFTGNIASSGGAIYNYGSGNTVSLINSSFTGNTATNLGGAIVFYGGSVSVDGCSFTSNTAFSSGGAIFSGGSVSLINSSFTSNTAFSSGGAIYNSYSYYGSLSVSGCSFSGNSASSSGGAIFSESGSVFITGCSFMGNTANNGSAIFNDGATMIANFNRIVGNDIESYGSLDAYYNWWGTNFEGTNPVTAGRVTGTGIMVNRWLVLTITANPTTINNGETSTITADLLHDQNGFYQNPDDGHVPDGIPVTFNTDLGSIGSKTIIKETKDGVATATLTADETVGIAHVNAVTDSQIVNTNVITNQIINSTITTTENKNNFTGQNVLLTANVKDDEGNNVNEGQVRFTVNGIIVDTVAVVDGLATSNWAIPPEWAVGIYEISAQFLGTDNYSTSDGNATLTVDSKPTNTFTENKKNLPGQNVELKAVVKDYYGNNVNGGQVRFTVNGIIVDTVAVVDGQAVLNCTIPLEWVPGNKIIKAEFLGTDDYNTSNGTATLTVVLKPAAWANVKGGLFNVNKNVYLYKNIQNGTIYYTRNGSTPTNASTKYTGYISISSSTTLKFIAIDQDGNKSPVYTEKYVIDKTAPKVTYTYPKNLSTGQSRIATLYLKFSENIKTSTYWSKIFVKDLKTGKKVSITKWIKGNILYIKTNYKRASLRSYQVYVPYKAVKDFAGNNLVKTFAYKFKTRS